MGNVVTLEPMLLMKMTAESIYIVAADNLEIDRICQVNLNISKDLCDVMDDGNHSDIQNEVQRYQAGFNYNQTLMGSIIPLIVVLLLGPLSDRYGRKPPMIAVLVGFIILSIVYLIESICLDLPAEFLYLGSLGVNLGGTWVVFNMAVYSYVADISTPESRTKRLGITDAVWYCGSPLGSFIGSYIYQYYSYVGVYSTSAFLWICSLLYLIVFVKESKKPSNVPPKQWSPVQHVKELFGVLFKKRNNHGRVILFCLLILKLSVFLIQGHQMLLWARKVLQWTPVIFSRWVGAENAIHQVGMVFWLWIAELIKLHNCFIATSGVVSIMFWAITLAIITGPNLWWLVIVASTLGLIEACIEPAIRCMMTIAVGEGEEGKVFAVNGVLEAGWIAVDKLIYTVLYTTYLETFPQILFVVEASICIPVIIGFIGLYFVMRIPQRADSQTLREATPPLGMPKNE